MYKLSNLPIIWPGLINLVAKIPFPAPGMPESLISTKLGVGNLSGFLVPLLATCSVHGNSGPCRSQYVDVTRCSHFQQSKEGGS